MCELGGEKAAVIPLSGQFSGLRKAHNLTRATNAKEK
ncbi:hypothetical protein BVIET440_270013 [Burkholderia vietnamiensis]